MPRDHRSADNLQRGMIVTAGGLDMHVPRLLSEAVFLCHWNQVFKLICPPGIMMKHAEIRLGQGMSTQKAASKTSLLYNPSGLKSDEKVLYLWFPLILRYPMVPRWYPMVSHPSQLPLELWGISPGQGALDLPTADWRCHRLWAHHHVRWRPKERKPKKVLLEQLSSLI